MKRALDSSLEWLILLSRVLSVVGGLAVIGLGITMAILGELLPWLGVWLQAVLWTIVFGWFGWFSARATFRKNVIPVHCMTG